MRRGCFDVDARIEDMNANGVLGSMCFPSYPSFCGALFARQPDKELALITMCCGGGLGTGTIVRRV